MKRRGCKGCALLEQYGGQWVNNLCPQCTELARRKTEQDKGEPLPASPRVVKRDETADRLRWHLRAMATSVPDVWKKVDRARAARAKALPDWPQWCFMPIAVSYYIISPDRRLDPAKEQASIIGALATLAAWRVTQGIYRYDPTVLDALCETPVTGVIPADALLAIPEWCVYIETPGRRCLNDDMYGFFAFLDNSSGDTELRIVADTSIGLNTMLPVFLGGTIEEGILRGAAEAEQEIKTHYPEGNPALIGQVHAHMGALTESVAPAVSVLLYLCSANAEMRDRSERRLRPARPQPVKTKDGMRLFPPNEPTTWEVAYRIGATIRGAMAEDVRRRSGDGTHMSPRPHIRRSHWHSFWTGAKAKLGQGPTDRQLVLKWLPPIPVNVDEATDIIPTIHKVV